MERPLPYQVAVLCYLFDEQARVLLIHRRKPPNQDLYSPIGGKLQQPSGESPTACAVREIGEDNVLFETDFPHPTCLYPNVRQHVEASLAGLSEQAQRKVLYENAARVYQLPLPLPH